MNRYLAGAIALAIAATTGGCATMAGPVADRAHNSRNSLDWAGTYRGVLPCADCPGIEMTVTLRPDGTYSTRSYYRDEGPTLTGEGRFTWSDDGGTVILTGEESASYRVGENRLTWLMLDGSPIEGPLAEHFVLTKVDGPLENGAAAAAVPIEGTRWTLVELRGQPVTGLERTPYLMLDAENERVSGFAGCNTFGGSYTLDEERLRISFGQLMTTLMACETGMDVERTLSEVLEQVDNYSLAGNRMTLNKARMAPLAVFEASAE